MARQEAAASLMMIPVEAKQVAGEEVEQFKADITAIQAEIQQAALMGIPQQDCLTAFISSMQGLVSEMVSGAGAAQEVAAQVNKRNGRAVLRIC